MVHFSIFGRKVCIQTTLSWRESKIWWIYYEHLLKNLKLFNIKYQMLYSAYAFWGIKCIFRWTYIDTRHARSLGRLGLWISRDQISIFRCTLILGMLARSADSANEFWGIIYIQIYIHWHSACSLARQTRPINYWLTKSKYIYMYIWYVYIYIYISIYIYIYIYI